ncbi:YhdP family protein [Massilia solisilvae]|uniref:YhdP family protein n=1 Tax=Massilia solisilvae TaxID=1811225 RepID=A0ABT2BII3_9BURK|nr:YhdP family protein [Massilia solisilvae]MCS0608272.1 YhdP family protein [Massilia solisilvae]
MHNPDPQTAHEHLPLAERWRRLRAAYRYANRASHHVLGFTLKLVLLVYFVFTALFLFLRYAVLPNIDYYKPDVERAASRVLGNQVTISRLYASWHGLHPNLFLGDVSLHDRQGRQLLALPSVSATLSWWSVIAAEPRFESLELIRPELDVRRTPDGTLFVAGVRLEQGKPGAPSGPDWLFRQREIVIREGRLHWTDEARGAPELALSGVSLVLVNHWNTHRFALKATPPAALGQPLDVRARFTHPSFGRPTDIARWKGELYADMRETDLAAWQQYVDYPFQLNRGRGSVRAWINLDHARLAGFTADVALAGVSTRLRPDLPPLELARVSGRLAASETLKPGEGDGKPTFGANGHSLALTDFTVATRDGVLLPPATVTETWRPAARGKPEQTEVQARRLDLAALARLAADLPLAPSQRQLLADFAPRGQLQDVTAQWEGHYPNLGSYRVRGKVANLSLKPQAARAAQPASGTLPAQPAQPALPGFDNLTGSIDASDRGGNVQLDSDKLVLYMPAWFADPAMPFDKVALQARWSYPQQDQLLVEVDSLHAEQGQLKATLSGHHVLPLGDGKGPGNADLAGTVDGFEINQVGRFLPLATPPHLREWLTGALQGGTLQNAALRLRGDLSHFPFRADNAAERAAGEFRAAGRIENGRLEYAPGHLAADGKAPLWPLAEQINGSIVFDRARMEIRGDNLRTLGVALSNVKAVIPDLGAPELMLDIDGSAAAPLQEFLRYVAASPVLEWIGHFTEDTRAAGNARLALKLHMPLDHLPETKVQGALALQGNEVTLFPELPPLAGSNGRIEFNERGFNLSGVSGNFLGAPLAVSGGTQRDGAIVVRLAGTLAGEGMRRTAPEPALQRLGRHLSGSTRYTGTVVVKDRQHTVTLDSNLAGLGMELPAPLNKVAGDALPLHFVLAGGPANETGVARDEIRIGLGNGVAARYLREKQAHGPWLVKRGGIGVNLPAPEPDSGMMLNVNMKALDVDRWVALGNELAGSDGKADASGTASAPASSGFAQYVVPDTVAARASELMFDERKLVDVVVGASHQKASWQASIHARQIVGYLTWDESPTGQGLGKVTARLASLVIPESAANEVKDLLVPDKPHASSIPALDIVADRFELFNKQFGRLELNASNVAAGAAAVREWRIDRLALSNPDGVLRATGRWLTREGNSNTGMNFTLDINDAGKLLDRLGFPETLKHGKGKLSGDIAWNGLPYSLDIPSLSGKIQMNVEDGQFLKQDPGAAKLLGVLSLQALPRLLKLDFHDVFAEGLAFDAITANAAITRGVVKTDNLKMRGVAATVLMDGTADIANESTNLHVVVIPEFNLGTGPLVYALAVNPVIGLGSFLAQLFIRAPVMKALTYQLQVTGPWKSPTITRLDSNQEQGQQQATTNKESP